MANSPTIEKTSRLVLGAGEPAPASQALVDAVLDALPSANTRRSYDRALADLAAYAKGRPITRTLVLNWRRSMAKLSTSTVNVRLSAVRKLVQEALRTGVITGDEYAELVHVKGMPRRGARTGRWLTRDEARRLLAVPDRSTLLGKRNYAILHLLVTCALRAEEISIIHVDTMQRREGRWVLADLEGKGGRIRTVPLPATAKTAIDAWLKAAGIEKGVVIRPQSRKNVALSYTAIYDVVREAGLEIGIEIAPHDLRRTCAKLCRKRGGRLEQIQLLLGHASISTTEIYLGSDLDLENAVNDDLGL